MKTLLLILFFGISIASVYSNQVVDISILTQTEILHQAELSFVNDMTKVEIQPKFRKFKAAVLAILLGHFGVHRIYLGTATNVPVFYSLTLGGGLGLLPLLDFIAIVSAKDLDNYVNNDKVFMWNEKTSD